MLEIEQNDQPDDPGSSSADAPADAPRPRRRRAATRPAGPPTPSAEAAPTAGDAPDGDPAGGAPTGTEAVTEAASVPAPAKKTAKRAPRKTAASSDGAAAKTPRKRTTKKAAPAAPAEELEPESAPAARTRAVGTPAPMPDLAPSEAALLAAVEAAEVTSEAAGVVRAAEPPEPVQENWLPSEEPAPIEQKPAAAADEAVGAEPVEGTGEKPADIEISDIQSAETAETEAADTGTAESDTADIQTTENAENWAAQTEAAGDQTAETADSETADTATAQTETAESAGTQTVSADGAEPVDREYSEDRLGEVRSSEGDSGASGEGESGESGESGEVEPGEGESGESGESGEVEPGEVEPEEDEESDEDAAESTEGGGTGRRRRRRRGGRRRRRGGGSGGEGSEEGDADAPSGATTDSTTDGGPSAQPADPQASDEAGGGEQVAAVDRAVESADAAPGDNAAPGGNAAASDAAAADDATPSEDDTSAGEGDGDGQRRRRRRRRRRGEDSSGSPDDPAEVVVRVRERGGKRKTSDEPAGIEGSTRLEAKRQRRREGREAGRRRAPILSEAEFLARRESVKRAMVIRQRDDPSSSGGTLTQIAVLEDDILVEHYVDRDSAASLIGNVYLGRVQNVLPSMEAAFIDIGRGRNAVLYAGEVDWDAFGAEGQARKVEKVLKSGQTVLVQVTKDPVGAKGARLTNHVSIPGRYIVYAPGGHLSGISRKLPDTERKRLKDILADLVPESASVIVRTAAEGASEEELVRDVNRLKAQWEDIEKKVKAGQAPQLLYGEPDLTLRIVRDLFTEDFSELLVAGNDGPDDAYDAIEAYVGHVAPHLADRLRRWSTDDGEDIFAAYRIDEQIAKALERKVFLPSGGSLVIDRTEAMTVIDVNTGKFTGTGGNLEATVTSNNLEAAEEIVRQLRLRDLGGIIVIDFIDMVLPSNRELLLRRLVECLGRDRTRHQVAEVTSLGLVQMTRKRIGTGLLEAFSTECEHCHGRGYDIHDVPVESQKQADGGARERGGRQRGGRRSGSGAGVRGASGGGGSHGSNGSQDSSSAADRSAETPAPVG